MTIPSAQENKENKEKQTREQENKTAKPPLRWDEQVNKEIATLGEITNTTNIEQSEHIESNPEAKNTQVIDAKCSNSTNEIKVDNILDSEDFVEDLDCTEGYVTAASSKYKNVEKNTKQSENEHTQTDCRLENEHQTTPKKSWSSLFPKLTRGKTTFSSFSPRNTLKTKNDNALIITTSSLQCSFNEIMEDLFKTAGYDINAAKQHFNRGKRSHIEIIFKDKATLQKYAAKGLMIKGRTYFGYIPTDARKSYFSIKCRNVPLGDKNEISEALLEAFTDIGNVSSIRPLLIEGTPYLSDQWIVVFDTTDDSTLERRIPRFTHIWDNKVTTEWRSAPKVCYFCEEEGHIKKDCQQLKSSIEARERARREWNVHSLGTSIENEGQEDSTPLDDHMTDSEATEIQSELIEVAENGNDMQIDGFSVKPEETISNADTSVTPQIPIMGLADELSTAYNDERPAADSMAVNETTSPNTLPDSISPKNGVDENDSLTLMKRANNKKRKSTNSKVDKKEKSRPAPYTNKGEGTNPKH